MANPCSKTQDFVHLHVHSSFSFLDGASSIEDLVRRAAEHGQSTLALTDHDALCGAPAFARACAAAGIKPLFGAELTLRSGHVTAIARTRRGYSSLCRLLTESHLRNPRGFPVLDEIVLLAEGHDLIVLSGCAQSPLVKLLERRCFTEAHRWAEMLRGRYGDSFFIEIQRTLEPQQEFVNAKLVALARELGIPLVATHNVHYARAQGARAQDVLCCIRERITLDDAHERRKISGELYLASGQEMAQRFSDLPDALQNTVEIADRCERFEIGEPRFLPRFGCGDSENAARTLRELTLLGARRRTGRISASLKARLDYELQIISDLGFADYFLVVRDLVGFAVRNQIRHAGRGSAADSAVAYCLDITKVDAFGRNLRFERFINPERAHNLPDIDIDFDSRYRDDVTAYVTQKYGEDHVATVCTFARFRARSAIRNVAKTLGFPEEDIDRIAKTTHWATTARGIRRAISERPEMRALSIPPKKFDLLFDLCAALDDLPRHISTHLGGVVITGDPICEIAPLQKAAKGVNIIQYDKDGVEDLGLLKLDLLCLRMLGAVEDSVRMIERRDREFDYDRIPLDDEATFEMIREANTAGAFQIESPAQMSLHPRLQTSTYEDVVASVALIRPGPVKGEMVEPFIRRRRGLEAVTTIHPVMERILGHTYGVVLYQEQVVSIAVELAGFSPGQADTLRRAISHHRSTERMHEIGEQFVAQAILNGVDRATAETVFSWLEGYAGYGFCEAHAAAFGDTSFRTAYLLRHHPAEFFAAILSNEPMGFYPAHTIVNEARCRGIRILRPDVQHSGKDFAVEEGAIRVGMKQVKSISAAHIEAIITERPFASLNNFSERTRVPRDLLENLALSGALDGFHPNRRALLFGLGDLRHSMPDELPLDGTEISGRDVADFSPYERMCHEWEILGFCAEHHPLTFWRDSLSAQGVLRNAEIRAITDTSRLLRAAGWVIRPHTPPTKSGKTVVFLSLEDETGLLHVTVFPAVYERFGHLIFGSPMLRVDGRKDRRGANSLVAERIAKMSGPGSSAVGDRGQ